MVIYVHLFVYSFFEITENFLSVRPFAHFVESTIYHHLSVIKTESSSWKLCKYGLPNFPDVVTVTDRNNCHQYFDNAIVTPTLHYSLSKDEDNIFYPKSYIYLLFLRLVFTANLLIRFRKIG